MKKYWTAFGLLGLFCGLYLSLALYAQEDPSLSVFVPGGGETTIVIDAGHGGEDGGAVSVHGVSESHINLDIALKLEQVLALYGVQPVMLREEDISLHSSGANTLREKKSSDLKNRVERIEEIEGATVVSIHQNSFPQVQYYGAQVFYAPTEGSMELAGSVQDTLREALDPDNDREEKLIYDTVYLMNHISCRAILVECGFLSNEREAQLLQDGTYQQKIAAAIASVLLNEGDTPITG